MAIIAFLASFLIARLISLSAHRLGLVQMPNHRSSHFTPTPSGGGLGIAIAGCVCTLPLVVGQSAPITWTIAVSAVGGLIGFLDDRLDLPARYRIVCHIALVGVLALFVLGLSVPGTGENELMTIVTFGAVLFLGVWWINLFNFMDGIDGIAASEAIFILVTAVALVMAGNFGEASWIVVFPLIVVVAACLGFLLLNWPPARVFMGDAGSNYLAFFLLGMSFVSFAHGYMSAAMWAILPATFVVDATVTLLRRVTTGERWFAAHREHTYQRLARRWNGHLKVTLLYGVINIVWLLPLALMARNLPSIDWIIIVVAYIPLVALCIAAQVGLTDKAATNNRKPT